MEELIHIEQACRDNNHESITQALDAIASFEVKKESFLKIIDYYENIESRLPVGYYMLFIEWLLMNREVDAAADYVTRLNQLGVTKGRISELISKYVIRPDASYYKERFDRNLDILITNKVLISTHTIEFEHASKNITALRNYQTEFSADNIEEENVSLLAVDITDFQLIERTLGKGHLIHIIYHDVKKLYFMLLFEDLGVIGKYVEKGMIVILAESNEESIRRFFSNMMVMTPQHIFATPDMHQHYHDMLSELRNEKIRGYLSHMEDLKTYYRNKGFTYYRELFAQEPSDIKVLVITSETTELNKFIAKNWYEAFLELGYSVRLLIENNRYERMLVFHMVEQIYELKPHIIFQINYPVNCIFEQQHDVMDNLLWIMRYRDRIYDEIYCGNTFFLPIHNAFAENLNERGISEKRIFTTPDSVSFNRFRKNGVVNDKYVCDITCVNNAGGAETFRLNSYLKDMNSERAKKVLNDIFTDLREMLDDSHVFTPIDVKYFIHERIKYLGINMPRSGKDYLASFASMTMESLYRGKIIEWIIESGITRNIKLWGKYWSSKETFRNYHMGEARHGEELASIYENSRISISDVYWLHERNFEILASGGFPLVRYKTLEESVKKNKVTNYFRENEEIVVFYSKDDLLNKIQYYLDNPVERDRVAERGRQVVLNNFSHTAIARKAMDFVKTYYQNQSGKIQ